MATLQVVKSSLASFSVSRRSEISRRQISRDRIVFCRGFRILCKVKQDDNQNTGEEPPESLFMKELKRRGMNPSTSLLEESNRITYGEGESKYKEEGGYTKRNVVSTEYEKSLTKQRETSMGLNSEGLEGLIPRAKVLLSIGASFFLGFGPFILITVATFCALYLYFGPAFIHDASRTPISPPPYVDPYALLEDERISQMTRSN